VSSGAPDRGWRILLMWKKKDGLRVEPGRKNRRIVIVQRAKRLESIRYRNVETREES
jgi:hypothetical protein